MQTLGLQTVLGMSNAVERVQQTAQTHGAVTAEQFKDILDKQTDLKKTEVQTAEQSATDVRIREETRQRQQQERREEQKREAAGAKKEEEHEEPKAVSKAEEAPQGRLLDIKV